MTKCFLLLFTIIGHNIFAQNSSPTKSQLLKIFKKSIQQSTKGMVSTNSNPWVVCNKDSAFYKSDTLRLYNNVNYYYYSKCCDFIDLTFYKKNAFVAIQTRVCKEPPTSTFATKDDWFTVELIKSKSSLIMLTVNQGKIVDRFKVISIGEINNIGHPNDITKVLTLFRQKTYIN